MMAQTDINMTPHKIGMWLLLNMILILHRLDFWFLMIRQVSSDTRFQDVAFCGSLIGLILSTQIETTWRKDNFWKNHVAPSTFMFLPPTKNQCIESKITGTPRRFFNGISVTFHGVTHANQAVGIPSACANASGNLGYRWVREAQCRSGVNYGNSKKSRVTYINIYIL